MSYDDDIVIDETALDVEWLEQPRMMLKYAKLVAKAQYDLDLAKEERDSVKARLDKRIREDPEGHGVVAGSRGVTEGSIAAAVQVHPEYDKVNQAYMSSVYEHNVASGVVRAFDQRKSALENLVRLHGQQYFAGPSVPRDLSEERKRRDSDANGRVRMRRRNA